MASMWLRGWTLFAVTGREENMMYKLEQCNHSKKKAYEKRWYPNLSLDGEMTTLTSGYSHLGVIPVALRGAYCTSIPHCVHFYDTCDTAVPN